MAWKETHVMNERMKFIEEWQAGGHSLAELCRCHGVSRKTGYKFIELLFGGGAGRARWSRAPHHHPNAIDERRELAILALQAKHPTWGAKKLKRWLDVPSTTGVAGAQRDHRDARSRLVRRPGCTARSVDCAADAELANRLGHRLPRMVPDQRWSACDRYGE